MAKGFDDTGGLLFWILLGVCGTIGFTIAVIVELPLPEIFTPFVGALLGAVLFQSLLSGIYTFNPFGARALLVGETDE